MNYINGWRKEVWSGDTFWKTNHKQSTYINGVVVKRVWSQARFWIKSSGPWVRFCKVFSNCLAVLRWVTRAWERVKAISWQRVGDMRNCGSWVEGKGEKSLDLLTFEEVEKEETELWLWSTKYLENSGINKQSICEN